MSQDFLSLPFDGTEARPREITAAQRRRLYRDLWSDMIVRAFTFEPTGNGNFSVQGTCLVNGAYADFNNLTFNTAGVQAGQTQVVARIVSDGQGGEDVGIRFVSAVGANDLLIGVASLAAGPIVTRIDGLGLSPIRIPSGSITRDRLAADVVPAYQFIERTSTAWLTLTTAWQIYSLPAMVNSLTSPVMSGGTQGVAFNASGTYRVTVSALATETNNAPVNVDLGIRQAAGQEIVLSTESVRAWGLSTLTGSTVVRASAGSAVFMVARLGTGAARISDPRLLVETWQPWM